MYRCKYTDLKRERKQVGTNKIALVTSIGAGESYDQAPFLFKVERERRERERREREKREREKCERKMRPPLCSRWRAREKRKRVESELV